MSEQDLKNILESQLVDQATLEESKRVDRRRDIAYKVGKKGVQLTMKAATTAASNAASTAATTAATTAVTTTNTVIITGP